VALALGVASACADAPIDRPAPAPPQRPATQAAAGVPPTPEHPSGRFLPTWLPAGLGIRVEQEWGATPASPATGWTRTYIRRGPNYAQDVVTISLEEGAPALDVDLEVTRYAGAERVTVQDRPAVLLALVAGRHQAALVWSPAPGRLAQVLGSGVSEEELSVVAEGFSLPPRLDATPVPQGFSELQRSDEHAYPPSIPRRYAVNTVPLRGGARPEGTPRVQVMAGWGGALPAGGEVAVRDRRGVVTSDGDQTVLAWWERADLLVTVTGTTVSVEDLRRVASELREQSREEVQARPTGAPRVLVRGDVGGVPYELRTTNGAAGPCLELVHSWVQNQCGGDPLQAVVEFESAIFQGLAYGSVLLDATSVRLELDGGRSVETVPVGKDAGLGTAFYVVPVPPDARVLLVVALAADGQVLRRTPAG
jgi:hypothetical protein